MAEVVDPNLQNDPVQNDPVQNDPGQNDPVQNDAPQKDMAFQETYDDPIVPVDQRSCTDCCCLVSYFVLAGIILALGIYAWIAGNFSNLTTAYDPDGKGCGVAYPKYPYIYFASPHTNSLWVTVCVSKCPVATDPVLYCQPNSVVTSCTAKPNTGNNQAAVEIYNTYVFANTICMPTSSTVRAKLAAALGTSATAMTSLMQNWPLLLFSIPIAIILALIFMLLIRCCAGCFIYILIFLAIGALVGFGVYLLITPANPVAGTSAGKTGSIIIAVLCFFFAFLILLLVCCFRKRISLATSIIKVAANFISSHCTIVLLPVFLFGVTLLFLVLWVMQALGFYSLGTPYHTPHQYPFAHFKISVWIEILFAIHVIFLLWTLMFFIETSTFIVGGTATSWYYGRNSPYSEASARYRKKHMGSVALGAFLLIVFGIIRIIFEALYPQSVDQPNCWQKCCNCCCCCCTKIFDWFTTGAFTVINVRGTPFCSSGYEAFSLKLASLGASSIVAIVQAIFTLLVRLGITFLTMLIVYILIKTIPVYQKSVQDATLIMVVVGFTAFTISCFFISVYSDSIDAIYITYLIDRERGDSNTEAPQELKDFLEEADKQEANNIN